jgi:hypothetical protein
LPRFSASTQMTCAKLLIPTNRTDIDVRTQSLRLAK